ncbi:MAG: DNA polymerase III subunit beta [Lachnospiraceae bacterium]|nr:DNA polymerase III subunit beta [Lachnospiraceae bacterium]
MKIICSKDILSKAVSTVLKAIPGKTTMPILECILINAEGNKIKLTATDTELGIETTIEGNITQPGRIAIEAKIFSEIIRRLPDNDIIITTDENSNMTIECEKAVFNIAGYDGYDFQALPSFEHKSYISLSQMTLKDIIRQTIFSISENENNRLMSGELMEIKNGILRLVSLDGHRISIRRVELKDKYDDTKVIVPGKTLSEIAKILTGGVDDEVLIYFGTNHILFAFEDTLVVSRLIDGEYFKIDNMLNNDYSTKLSVNKRDFLNCIDRSTLLVKESDKKPLIFTVEDSNLQLSMRSSIGSLCEDLGVVKEGNDIKIGFNPRFLLDALRVIDDENVDIYMMNPKAPCFIKDKEETYIYLILPVNFAQA